MEVCIRPIAHACKLMGLWISGSILMSCTLISTPENVGTMHNIDHINRLTTSKVDLNFLGAG